MASRLMMIRGPMKDVILPLAEESVSIGRDPSNNWPLDDPHVSAKHCSVSEESGRRVLLDLDSSSGTFVNGERVKRKTLEHGDRIAVGHSVFLFLDEEEAGVRGNPVEFDEAPVAGSRPVEVGGDEAAYLPRESLASLPPAARTERQLQTMIKISKAIGSVRNVESIEWQLLGTLFDVVPAERGAILLVGSRPDEFISMTGWDFVLGPNRPVRVHRSLVERAAREGVSLVKNADDARETELAATAPAGGGARSIMCVPIPLSGKMIGVIYLDTCNAATRFEDEQVELVMAIAGIAAIALENARQMEMLERENQRLRAKLELDSDMIGCSARIREVLQTILRLAPTETTVLICGESGTGKELAARALHRNSRRANRPFVAVNCAALPENLLESELFGYEKGAFTGAVAQKKGQLELADGGTFFFDEISELSPALQAKLLRVLQEREIVRVGGQRPIKLDLRMIAATNQDLTQAVKESRFRQDLYYRLNVVSFTLPALRERAEDIPTLAEFFAGKFAEKCKRRITGISPQARACLTRYDWPGNVRELENAIEHAVVLGSSEMILPDDLPEAILEAGSPDAALASTYHEALRDLKRRLILQAVEQAGGNYTEAAKRLGVHPNYLHRLIRNLDLRGELRRGA